MLDSVQRISPRLRAAAIHALLSLACALLVAVLVLFLWYPAPYGVLSGGSQLFSLVVSVDVVMGPLLTLVVFNVKKTRAELLRDLAIIIVLQVGALGYGLHTTFVARPVVLVFEVDRFRVVAANDVLLDDLPGAAPGFRSLSLLGPRLISVRKPEGVEVDKAVKLLFKGYDVGQCPRYWVPYSPAIATGKAHKLELLIKHNPQSRMDIEARVKALGLTSDTALYLPVLSRADKWVVILDASGSLAGFMPYDG